MLLVDVGLMKLIIVLSILHAVIQGDSPELEAEGASDLVRGLFLVESW